MNVGGGTPYPQNPPPPYGPPQPPPPGIHVPQQPYGFQDSRQYPPGVASPATTVTVIQVPNVARLGPESGFATCPSCHAQVTTRVSHEPSSRTHLAALLLCLLGLWPCCLVPYCMDSCQSSIHHCPNCGVFIGAYRQ